MRYVWVQFWWTGFEAEKSGELIPIERWSIDQELEWSNDERKKKRFGICEDVRDFWIEASQQVPIVRSLKL